MEKKFLFDIGITNATEKEILEYIITSLEKNGERYYIVTPNPEIIVYATKHAGLKDILNNARLALCDGMGVFIASKILGKSLVARTTGVDLMESLCREVSKKPITVGFLGGRGKVAELTAERLVSKYPGLKVSFAVEELPILGAKQQEVSRIKYLVSSGNEKIQNTRYKIPNTDILFVAFGFPKQEEWMKEHIGKIPVRVAMGVGGSFDYVSGKVARAPKVVRQSGFEWFYRLLKEPWRWKRQLALFQFVGLLLKEKIKM